MIKKPSACLGCPLYGTGHGFSKLRGQGEERILIVGEALGEQEEGAGLPFVGKTGQFLSRVVSRTFDPAKGRVLDLDRDFWITNVVRCRPPQNILAGASYEKEAIARCRSYLEETVRATRPAAILGVGGVALQALTGHSGIDSLRGYAFPTDWGIPAVATYHPSFIVRGNFELVRVVQVDLLKTLTIARHGILKKPKRYVLSPTPDDVRAWVAAYEAALAADPSLVLAFDIETPYGAKDEDAWDLEDEDSSWNILRISFSFKEHEAITMPWMEPFTGFARRLLASPGTKTTWNGTQYDIPRLLANDSPVNGPHWDAMLAWKCYEPALPMGLKFVATVLCPDVEAWKLKSTSDPEYYSAADSDILLRCMNHIKRGLETQNKWAMFQRHFIELSQVLLEMTKVGMRVDPVKRKEAKEQILARLASTTQEIQLLVPPVLRPLKPFKIPLETLLKKGYTRDQLVLVDTEVPSLKKGWMVGPEGYLVREPKPPKKARKKKTKGEGEAVGVAPGVQPDLPEAAPRVHPTQGLSAEAGPQDPQAHHQPRDPALLRREVRRPLPREGN